MAALHHLCAFACASPRNSRADQKFCVTPGYSERLGPYDLYRDTYRDAYLRGYDNGFRHAQRSGN